jgi:hypothetical protein
VFVVRVCGGQYREELILNVTVLVVSVLQRAIERGNYTECHYVLDESMDERNRNKKITDFHNVFVRVWVGQNGELILNIAVFFMRFWTRAI